MRKTLIFSSLLLLGLGIHTAYRLWDRDRQRELVMLRQAEGRMEERLWRAIPRAPAVARRTPKIHDRLGQLEIPAIHVSVAVVEGADTGGLRMGAAHIIGTGYPGDAANVGIAAHRDTYFRALRRIQRGDVIVLTTSAGNFRYEVDGTEIVMPKDVGVLQSAGRAEMTLVTCYPFYYVGHAPERFIVHARLLSSRPEGARG